MVAIVAIGDELLSGATMNTNAQTIAQALNRVGCKTTLMLTLPDNPKVLFDSLCTLLKNGYTVITTGGLGPTCDDHTRVVAAELFHRTLTFYAECYADLEKRFGAICPTLHDQVVLPQGAQLFPNGVGTAYGFMLEDQQLYPGAKFFALPGPPLEMRPMLHASVVPLLANNEGESKVELFLGGIYEHEVDPFLRVLQDCYPHCSFGIYPGIGVVTVRVSGSDSKALTLIHKALQQQFQAYLFQGTEGTLEEYFYDLMKRKGLTCGTAESCTAGALAAAITKVPGASSIFLGSVVAYSNRVKMGLLGVGEAELAAYGAVSSEVTTAMAKGVQNLLGVDLAIAVSGILGPDGGTLEKPVGTIVYTMICRGQEKQVHLVSEVLHLVGDRLEIRERVVQLILTKLCTFVKQVH